MSYGGVANRYNAFMVNGVANNDMYGLSSSGTNGGLSNANPVALDAIEQIEVAVASYDVRMSGFGGGAINAITKSGTNEFNGSAYTYYNNQDFYGTTAGRDVANRKKLEQQSTQIYGVTLGGPIVKNKLFFFVSGEYNLDSSPSSYYWGFDGVALDKAELDRISNRYKALTGYDGGGYGRQTLKKQTASLIARLDWNINSRHKTCRIKRILARSVRPFRYMYFRRYLLLCLHPEMIQESVAISFVGKPDFIRTSFLNLTNRLPPIWPPPRKWEQPLPVISWSPDSLPSTNWYITN